MLFTIKQRTIEKKIPSKQVNFLNLFGHLFTISFFRLIPPLEKNLFTLRYLILCVFRGLIVFILVTKSIVFIFNINEGLKLIIQIIAVNLNIINIKIPIYYVSEFCN